MLVVDPSRRITVAQIKQHRWMLADPTAAHQTLSHSLTEYNSNLGDYSEPVLGIMNALGIDRRRTIEVNRTKSLGEKKQQLNRVLKEGGTNQLSVPFTVSAEQQLQPFLRYLLPTTRESERAPNAAT